MSVAVVGAITFDDITTPRGSVRRVLGGSAAYVAVAAALLTQAHVVSVVGSDLPESWLGRLRGRGVDLAGVRVAAGPTFHWGCRYAANLEDRETLFTRPGTFGRVAVRVPGEAAGASHVFLTSGDPRQNRAALPQFRGRRVTMLDTIERELEGQRDEFLAAMGACDIVAINAAEARLLLGDAADAVAAGGEVAARAAALVRSQGADTLLLKRGPAGAEILHAGERRAIPAVAGCAVVDPTGAGDSFAGGVLSALERGAALVDAVRWGNAVASYTIGGFGLDGLWEATAAGVAARARGIGLGEAGWLRGRPAAARPGGGSGT